MRRIDPRRPGSRVSEALRGFLSEERGFAAAESVLLALLLIGISIVTGTILQQAAVKAAQNLNQELAGTQ